jgi:prepilin-type N-terminal cleavage/methylation domain-containing protein
MSESAPRRRHGFSLVELLVAVIAAVLLLVALPVTSLWS